MAQNDMAGVKLQEPEQVDWDKVGAGSSYTPPPPAKGVDGKAIVYFGQLPTNIVAEVNDEGWRTYTLDPIKLVKNGPGVDGYTLRFTRTSLKPFKNGANSTALLLKAAGIVAKPQKTAEYDAVIKQVGGKVVPFTIDWEAKNKDTGEKVSGYENFPDDPQRPGFKKAILKKGDVVKVDGAEHVIESEVLFANARQRFFEVKSK